MTTLKQKQMKKILCLIMFIVATCTASMLDANAQNKKSIDISIKGGKIVKIDGIRYIGYRTVEKTEILTADGDRSIIITCKGRGVTEMPDISFTLSNDTDTILQSVLNNAIERIKQAIDSGTTHGNISENGYHFIWIDGNKKLDKDSGKYVYDYKVEITHD